MTSPPRLLASSDGPLAWLAFDNPSRRNAISKEMWLAIPQVLQGFERDPAVRAIIVTGAGEGAFAAGADISQFERERASTAAVENYEQAAERAFEAFAEIDKPLIAQIHGPCIGGGLGIALACDMRIAAVDARFAIPAAKLGLAYSFSGVRKLVDIVGPGYAKEIFFTARSFDAAEALQMRLVNRVVPKHELEPAVTALAREIAQNAPLTIRAAKLAVDAAAALVPAAVDLSEVDTAVARCFASIDYVEGRRAFMEKRRPVFQGQ